MYTVISLLCTLSLVWQAPLEKGVWNMPSVPKKLGILNRLRASNGLKDRNVSSLPEITTQERIGITSEFDNESFSRCQFAPVAFLNITNPNKVKRKLPSCSWIRSIWYEYVDIVFVSGLLPNCLPGKRVKALESCNTKLKLFISKGIVGSSGYSCANTRITLFLFWNMSLHVWLSLSLDLRPNGAMYMM